MMAASFLAYVLVVGAVVCACTLRFLPARAGGWVTAELSAWLLYVGTLGLMGVLRNPDMRPPGSAFVLLPVAAFIVVVAWSLSGRRVATFVPLALLLARSASGSAL
ncbi:hypothetical protein [Lichenifustis flavocetrariae]|uniref:Uncharacterized protein n=1 Tax=Lichenifustis flavocetrariae TaxID=2949735 RepID=A0AA42CM94_9HYPH|nr:hypothetical protein [Lichenifustis flavocetrariae]MCW6512318.1 hypothetical protein [Lichenifustis flavocetrariae]